MKINAKGVKSSSLLAGATGIGSIGAALFGAPGAVGGALLGLAIGYWSDTTNEKSNSTYQSNRDKKAHA